jgi:hypothetical protein
MTQNKQGKAVEQQYKASFEDLREAALKHYDEASSAIHHWSSFVVSAIKAYQPSPNQTPSPQPGNEGQDDSETQAEVFLQNNFPSDYRYENDTISFRRIKPVIMLLQSQLSQEQTNHMHTRFAWDRTNEDRDNWRNEAKALTAIKKGLETSLSQAQEEIKALTGQLESAKGVIEFCGKENREQREEIKRLTPTTQSKP